MTERPILFSGPMVRAILDGRKTQTRRVAKSCFDDLKGQSHFNVSKCLYGAPGDRLWVRETFAHMYRGNAVPEARRDEDVVYAADGLNPDRYVYGSWKPSIHMPRWASRITLEVTGVRVERLDDIGEKDARNEGVTIEDRHMNGYCAGETRPPSIRAFRELWESINGGESWSANPWVWVVEFKVIKAAGEKA